MDLKQYFHAIRPWFFTVLALYPIVAALTAVAVDDWSLRPSRLMQVALSALLFPGAFVRSERFHALLVIAVLLMAVTFITLFTLRLA